MPAARHDGVYIYNNSQNSKGCISIFARQNILQKISFGAKLRSRALDQVNYNSLFVIILNNICSPITDTLCMYRLLKLHKSTDCRTNFSKLAYYSEDNFDTCMSHTYDISIDSCHGVMDSPTYHDMTPLFLPASIDVN